MARVSLLINDPTNRLTLKAILEADGHEIVTAGPDVVIAGNPVSALEHARDLPTLVLANAGEIRHAVAAMRQGVYGYLFVPLQPGEAGIMVERALRFARPAEAAAGSSDVPRETTVEAAEAQLILDTLRQCRNNKSKTARLLGIGRNTLWRKLRKIKSAQSERRDSI